ncbi:MAG: polyhydroxyalkanoate depolymerase, partial [Planctomycetaceae bacterium]
LVLGALWGHSLVAGQAVAQQGVDAGKSQAAVQALTQSLGAAEFDASALEKAEFARVPLTKADAEVARAALWKHRAARLRVERQAEHEARELREGDLKMPFFYSVAGEKPKGGRSLWISLHGGGGAPPRVNDQQWENQKRLYKVEEGVYLAPRAPTNTWNLWHE